MKILGEKKHITPFGVAELHQCLKALFTTVPVTILHMVTINITMDANIIISVNVLFTAIFTVSMVMAKFVRIIATIMFFIASKGTIIMLMTVTHHFHLQDSRVSLLEMFIIVAFQITVKRQHPSTHTIVHYFIFIVTQLLIQITFISHHRKEKGNNSSKHVSEPLKRFQ